MNEPSAIRKETVILVHGTWAQPREGTVNWYQADENAEPTSSFANRINGALERCNSGARVNAHVPEHELPFYWTGNNHWADRSKASADLLFYCTRLILSGWRCHFVAHSHGGCVVLDMLSRLVDQRPNLVAGIGRIVTLGTPFLPVEPLALKTAHRRNLITRGLAFVVMNLWVAWVVFAALPESMGAITKVYPSVGPAFSATRPWLPPLGVLAVLLTFFASGRILLRPQYAEHWLYSTEVTQNDLPTRRKILFAINSKYDEALLLLRGIRLSDNPFAIRGGLLRYLALERKRHLQFQREKLHAIRRVKELDDDYQFAYHALSMLANFFMVVTIASVAASALYYVLGWAFLRYFAVRPELLATWLLFALPFFALTQGHEATRMFLKPVRSALDHAIFLSRVPALSLSFVVRQRWWQVFRTDAFGCTGLPFDAVVARRTPQYVAPDLYSYEELDPAVVAEAFKRRANANGGALSKLEEALLAPYVAGSRLALLLRDIESNASLVHSAYYSDDRCIQRIAIAIAGAGR